MSSLLQSLLNAEPLDLAALARRWGPDLPYLSHLKAAAPDEEPLLQRVQRMMDELRRSPPAPLTLGPRSWMRPWWSPMPAAYLAAFVRYAGIAAKEGQPTGRENPHPTDARELLRELGVPFQHRSHAVALLGNLARAGNLPRSGARAETYMRMACGFDTRALYRLREAELEQREDPPTQEAGALETFRSKMHEFGTFGRPRRPPLSAEEVEPVGYSEPGQLHRAMNALRYFDLVAGMNEREWFLERLRQERGRPTGRLHLLVGPAACGKSSWARENLPETTIVSTDRMREELTGDPADQSQNYLVFQRCMDRLRERLKEGEEAVFDATNYDERVRQMPIQTGRWSGAEIVAYFFDVGLAEALRRNRGRSRAVPEDVIRRHYRRLEPPALYEADRHRVVGTDGEARTYWPTEG